MSERAVAPEPPEPQPIEVLAGMMLGLRSGAAPLPAARGIAVVDALQSAMLPALSRPPCLVSFSGGRDSSAILAVAVDAARRHGLEAPVPATLRFPDAPETEESQWRDLVLGHLGLADHLTVDVGPELDALGPAALGMLRRHGVRFPGNAHMHIPIFEAARGGSVLTGVGGDELFETRGSRAVLLRHRRVSPRWRDLIAVPFSLMPAAVRAFERRVRRPEDFSYLTLAGRRRVNTAIAADEVRWPPRWDASVRHWYQSRAYAALDGALPLFGADYDVHVTNPFLAPTVLAELARTGGATGFDSRSQAMTDLFGARLPAQTLTRPGKATFGAPLFGPATRAFAQTWDGAGMDRAAVDVDALRREWLSPAPSFRSTMLLHEAWRRSPAGQACPSTPTS